MSAQSDSSLPQAQPTNDPSTQATTGATPSAPEQADVTTVTPFYWTFPPLKPREPLYPGTALTDGVNAEVLRLVGYRTKPTGYALWELAQLAAAEPRPKLWDTATISQEPVSGTQPQPPTTTSSIPKALADGILEFEPFHFFFYGTLQDPAQLSAVCELPPSSQPPVLRRARIRGWRVKMWAFLPMLVPCPLRATGARGEDSEEGKEKEKEEEEGVVEGYVWKCELPQYVDHLRHYETSNYRMEFCTIEVDSNEAGVEVDGGKAAAGKQERKTKVIENGRVFVGVADEDTLEEGSFDLSAWMARGGRGDPFI